MSVIRLYFKRGLLGFAIFISLLFSPSLASTLPFSFDPNATCGDFLRQYDPDAPDYFQYQGCDELDNLQSKPLEAWYKIEGK